MSKCFRRKKEETGRDKAAQTAHQFARNHVTRAKVFRNHQIKRYFEKSREENDEFQN